MGNAQFNTGDVIAIGAGSFVSVPLSLRRWQAAGIQVVQIGAESGEVVPENLERVGNALQLVVVEWVCYASGLKNDIRRIGEFCRKTNIPLLIDGVQGVGATAIDFDLNDVAALACGGQKWLRGPEGTGFLFVSPNIRARLVARRYGYRSLSNLQDLEPSIPELTSDARLFGEVGTLNTIGNVGFGEAVRQLLKSGIPNCTGRIINTAQKVLKTLQAVKSVEIITPSNPERHAGIISFRHQSRPSAEIVEALFRAGITVGSRRQLVRVSASHDIESDDLCERLRVVVSKPDSSSRP